MADKGAQKPAKEESKPDAQQKKKSNFFTSTPFIVAAVAITEAIIFFAAATLFGGGPEAAYGDQAGQHYAEGEDPAALRETAEVGIIEHFRIPNDKSGAQHLYDFDLAIKVARKDAERIAEQITMRRSEILDHISRIVRGADPPILHEPALKTLRLKLRHALGELIGEPEAILEVLIPRCVPMRAG